jgi:hypothetical protein
METFKTSTAHNRALHILAMRLLEAAAGAAAFAIVARHVYLLDFKPLAALCLPVQVALFGFTSLLYMRGRSLSRSRDQLRTLFAAERAMQAAIWYCTGIVLGSALAGALPWSWIGHDPAEPNLSSLVLLLFLVPYTLMQVGFVIFLRAAGIIAPQFIRRVTPYEVWRRIRYAPA